MKYKKENLLKPHFQTMVCFYKEDLQFKHLEDIKHIYGFRRYPDAIKFIIAEHKRLTEHIRFKRFSDGSVMCLEQKKEELEE